LQKQVFIEGKTNFPFIGKVGLDTDGLIHLYSSLTFQQWFFGTQLVANQMIIIHRKVWQQFLGYIYYQEFKEKQTWEFCKQEVDEFLKKMGASVFEKDTFDVTRGDEIFKKFNPINGVCDTDCFIIAGYERIKASVIYSGTDHFIKTAKAVGLHCRSFPSEEGIYKRMI